MQSFSWLVPRNKLRTSPTGTWIRGSSVPYGGRGDIVAKCTTTESYTCFVDALSSVSSIKWVNVSVYWLIDVWITVQLNEYMLSICCFRLELNGHRRRLTWEATPRSIHDGVQAAINSSDCLVFDTNIAQLFADNGNLGINVTINMCQQ